MSSKYVPLTLTLSFMYLYKSSNFSVIPHLLNVYKSLFMKIITFQSKQKMLKVSHFCGVVIGQN